MKRITISERMNQGIRLKDWHKTGFLAHPDDTRAKILCNKLPGARCYFSDQEHVLYFEELLDLATFRMAFASS